MRLDLAGTWRTLVQTPPLSIGMFVLAALLGALGQYLYKSGADAAGDSVASYLLNARLWGGAMTFTWIPRSNNTATLNCWQGRLWKAL